MLLPYFPDHNMILILIDLWKINDYLLSNNHIEDYNTFFDNKLTGTIGGRQRSNWLVVLSSLFHKHYLWWLFLWQEGLILAIHVQPSNHITSQIRWKMYSITLCIMMQLVNNTLIMACKLQAQTQLTGAKQCTSLGAINDWGKES